MKKLFLIVVFTFLMFAQLTLAADFTTSIEAGDSYLAGREGAMTVSITNNGPTEWFSVSIIGLPADWLVLDTTSGLFKIESGQTYDIDIAVNPGKDAIPLTYEYFINVKNTKTDEVIEQRVLLPVKQVTDVIITNFDTSCLECNKEITVSGEINNVGTRDIPVTFTLKFMDEVKTIEFAELKAIEQQDFAYTFDLSELPPETYEISGEIVSGNKILYQDTIEFAIPTVQNVVMNESSFNTPFGRFVRINAINEGNARTDAEFVSEVKKAWYIVYAGPEPRTEGNVSTWIMSLEPEEEYELGYSEIYWPTYVVVAVLIIFGFMLYLNYTAIEMRKTIVGKHVVKPGHEMSVSIAVRNKIRTLTNIVIKDIVPDGFTLVTKFATLKPTLRKVSGGTEVVWKIGDLKPQEQRVLHYKMKATHGMRGRKHLPKATLIGKYREKTVKKSSNLISIYSKGQEPSIIAVDITKE